MTVFEMYKRNLLSPVKSVVENSKTDLDFFSRGSTSVGRMS